jgi:hypothetical protein
MEHLTFRTSKEITQSPIMLQQMFPTHARGMATVRLDPPIHRFVNVVEARITELGNRIDAAGGTLEIELLLWVVDTIFDGMYEYLLTFDRSLTKFSQAASAALFEETFMIRT